MKVEDVGVLLNFEGIVKCWTVQCWKMLSVFVNKIYLVSNQVVADLHMDGVDRNWY